MKKCCTKCGKEYPVTLEYFYKSTKGKNGFTSWCRICYKEAAKIFREKHPELYKKYRETYKTTPKSRKTKKNYELRRRFNITLEQYDKMFEEQNGVCAVCGLPEITKRLAVDHNHDTGEIRGLLCDRCNFTLGLVSENVDTLQNAINYLQERGAKCL